MRRFLPLYLVSGLLTGLALTAIVRADAISAVQVLRAGGCGGTSPAAPALHHDTQLDQAARQWAQGMGLSAATAGSGYGSGSAAGLHVSAPEDALLATIRRSGCRTLMDQDLRDVGEYKRGTETWLILAAPARFTQSPATSRGSGSASITPSVSAAPPAVLAARALQLVNDVRARGTRCGSRSFAPAPPVTLSSPLAGVALGHAADMATHNYFEHVDLTGHSPADRVRAVGYHEKLVGENIAYGPQSVEEVVQGWLDSPGHCENIMDPRFAEMGIAFASGQRVKHGLYWVQVLAEPRS
jgi:uncharacterized protein YkwD